MIEIWKNIEGYPNYQISNMGRVKNTKRNIIMRPSKSSGYYAINLYSNSKQKRFTIHRLVATFFVPNPKNLPCVNHIDGDKSNNLASNLEWCTHKENSKHAFENNLLKSSTLYKPKKLNQYDLNGNFIKQWNSQKEARDVYGKIHAAECHKGILKSSKGFIWRYAD